MDGEGLTPDELCQHVLNVIPLGTVLVELIANPADGKYGWRIREADPVQLRSELNYSSAAAALWDGLGVALGHFEAGQAGGLPS